MCTFEPEAQTNRGSESSSVGSSGTELEKIHSLRFLSPPRQSESAPFLRPTRPGHADSYPSRQEMVKREASPAGSPGEESKRIKGEKEKSQPPSSMDDELMRALQVSSSHCQRCNRFAKIQKSKFKISRSLANETRALLYSRSPPVA